MTNDDTCRFEVEDFASALAPPKNAQNGRVFLTTRYSKQVDSSQFLVDSKVSSTVDCQLLTVDARLRTIDTVSGILERLRRGLAKKLVLIFLERSSACST